MALAPEERAEPDRDDVERLAAEPLELPEPLELDRRALEPELDLADEDRFVVRLAPDERLLRELEPDEPPDDPALLLGWGMVVLLLGGPWGAVSTLVDAHITFGAIANQQVG